VRVKWLSQALADLLALEQYVRRDSPAAAIRVVRQIRKATMQLRRFPASGRRGRVARTRELVVPKTPYLIVYRIKSNTIQVLSVLHGTRAWPEEFFE